MNKLEEIDRLGKVIANSGYFGKHNDENMLAQDILDAGYGNIKQAVKEFAEKLKEIAIDISKDVGIEYSVLRTQTLLEQIDNLITELYGADE